MNELTRKLLEFLANPASYDHRPNSVRLIQTHASWVFIASPFVCKIKKPVDFGFLNFTTLDRRHANCEAEVRLNRRLAPNTYLSVLPITLGPAGFHFGDEPHGVIVEWAVWMKELDQDSFLSHRIRDGRLTPSDIQAVATRLESFYGQLKPLPEDQALKAVRRLQNFVADNFRAMHSFVGEILSEDTLNSIQSFANEFERAHESVFRDRASRGWIRECHGDLQLEHICLSGDSVEIFDCLEFSEDLRLIDVACDVAFPAMDLDFRHQHAMSRLLTNEIARHFHDAQFPWVMIYYQCYRACVRGKVECLRAVSETVSEEEQHSATMMAHRYFLLALRYSLFGTEPTVVAFLGRPASGKSWLAERLTTLTECRLISSDRTRKTLAGVDHFQRGTEAERRALYSDDLTRRVYDCMWHDAQVALQESPVVILDATFSLAEHRRRLAEECRRAGFRLVWVEAMADEQTTRQRLRERASRSDVVSDAREEDYEKLSARFEPTSDLARKDLIAIDTSANSTTTNSQLLLQLVKLNVSRDQTAG